MLKIILSIISFVFFAGLYLLRYKKNSKTKFLRIIFLFFSIATIIALIVVGGNGKTNLVFIFESEEIEVFFPEPYKSTIVDGYGNLYSCSTRYGGYKVVISELGNDNNIETILAGKDAEFDNVNIIEEAEKSVFIDFDDELDNVNVHIYLKAIELKEYLVMLIVIYRAGNMGVEDSFEQFMNPIVRTH